MSTPWIINLVLVFSGLSWTVALQAAEPDENPVPIGSQINDLQFKDIRCLQRNLSELGSHSAQVVVFTTTQCPLVKKSLPKLAEMSRKFQDRDVQFIAVNVGAEDSIKDMAAQAIDIDVPFYFVKDYDLSCVKALGVTRTPQVVVLDREHRLRYRGRIDDQLRLGGTLPKASRNDLEEAIAEVLAGQPVSISETPVDGCLITAAPRSDTASDITYYQDVAAILEKHCVRCHQPDSAAPFSLLTYEDAAGNSEMIAEVVRDESMPPWYASRRHGTFQNDAAISNLDKAKIYSWISAGRPAGNTEDASLVPLPPKGDWRIGKPDLVVTMLERHTVPATGFIPYRYTVLPHVFIGDTWVEAVEIRPENPAVVHHCNLAYITSEGAGVETFITGYVPGGQPLDLSHFQAGIAYRIPAGAALGLQIHYTSTGQEQQSRIQVGIRFPRNNINKSLQHFLLDPRGWKIPPQDPAFAIRSSHTLQHNADLLGLFTHMHVRGRDMTFAALFPDQRRETLLQIPNYNFEWQLGYELQSGSKILPRGTTVEAIAHFDNSPFNPYNPDSTKTVRYGPQTVDEMFNGYVFYVDHDEQLNIKVNPATGRVIAAVD